MRYDRKWLMGISDTRHLIDIAPIDEVPLPYRNLIKQQFDAHVESFRNSLSIGLDTTREQAAIFDIAHLAIDLVQEHKKEKAKAADCAAYAHPAYGR